MTSNIIKACLLKLLEEYIPIKDLNTIIFDYWKGVQAKVAKGVEARELYCHCYFCEIPKMTPTTTWNYSLIFNDAPDIHYRICEIDVCADEKCIGKAGNCLKLVEAKTMSKREWKMLKKVMRGRRPDARLNLICPECKKSRIYTTLASETNYGKYRNIDHFNAFRLCDEHTEAVVKILE